RKSGEKTRNVLIIICLAVAKRLSKYSVLTTGHYFHTLELHVTLLQTGSEGPARAKKATECKYPANSVSSSF
ncbi:hypothetical protein SOP87_30925, partial [Bacillus cereus]|uniref:hypothetical protein n=1 Tax=Bacillus cereus TaxID=1396 RepID=UPI002B241AC3